MHAFSCGGAVAGGGDEGFGVGALALAAASPSLPAAQRAAPQSLAAAQGAAAEAAALSEGGGGGLGSGGLDDGPSGGVFGPALKFALAGADHGKAGGAALLAHPASAT